MQAWVVGVYHTGTDAEYDAPLGKNKVELLQ